MGGGRTNGQQADAANAAANQQAAAAANLSNINANEQQQNFNYLFGSNGKGGSLTPFMDPNSLKVSTPTGAYKAQLNNTLNTLNNSFNQQRGSLAQSWANRGSGTMAPNGFQADQERQLGRDQADANGTAFTNAVTNQYQDALSNFWNANNIASGQAAGARTGALQGTQTAASTDTSLYGTASQFQPGIGAAIAGSALQAGGQVGAAAMCPCLGAKILTINGEKNAEYLRKGDLIYQRTGLYEPLEEDPIEMESHCVLVVTRKNRSTKVSRSHGYSVPSGGYVEAGEASGVEVCGYGAEDRIEAVYFRGVDKVLLLKIKGDRTYLCDGLWSLV